MYNFTREGFEGLPAGRDLSFYEDKLPGLRVFSSDDFYTRRIGAEIEIDGVDCGVLGNVDPDGIVDLIEITWETGDFSFEGILLSGVSIEDLTQELQQRGLSVKVDFDTLDLPEIQVSFFFYENITAAISWWIPSFLILPRRG